MGSGELQLHINRIVVDRALVAPTKVDLRTAIAEGLTQHLGSAEAPPVRGLAGNVAAAVVAAVAPHLTKRRSK